MKILKNLVLFSILFPLFVSGQTTLPNYYHNKTQATIDSLQKSGVDKILIYFRWNCVGCLQLLEGNTGKLKSGKFTYIIWQDSLAKCVRLVKYVDEKSLNGTLFCTYFEEIFVNYEKIKNEKDKAKSPGVSDGYSLSKLTILKKNDSLTFGFTDSYTKAEAVSFRQFYMNNIISCLLDFENK